MQMRHGLAMAKGNRGEVRVKALRITPFPLTLPMAYIALL